MNLFSDLATKVEKRAERTQLTPLEPGSVVTEETRLCIAFKHVGH